MVLESLTDTVYANPGSSHPEFTPEISWDLPHSGSSLVTLPILLPPSRTLLTEAPWSMSRPWTFLPPFETPIIPYRTRPPPDPCDGTQDWTVNEEGVPPVQEAST